MKFELVNPSALGAPKGYSNGVLVTGDCNWLFVAGQIGWGEGQKLASKDFGRQFDQALSNVLAIVAAAGGKPEHVVRLTIYVTSKKKYLAALKHVGAAYRERMGRHFPAMALLEVKDLLESGAKVEIEATAAIPRTAKRSPPARAKARTASRKPRRGAKA
jgi:enamine deaminase RidA (YjgF/YER057c/UK114 family)